MDIMKPTVRLEDLLVESVDKARAAGASEEEVFVHFGELARDLYRQVEAHDRFRDEAFGRPE